ncbi:importin-4 [Lates japonicus]|uniref:Importin-4 n=1 Tax=Lates japonicus TaxID=270547 RepID=A0AAD3NJU9_LATJO|nr:importin-4 [Lates japonicus]
MVNKTRTLACLLQLLVEIHQNGNPHDERVAVTPGDSPAVKALLHRLPHQLKADTLSVLAFVPLSKDVFSPLAAECVQLSLNLTDTIDDPDLRRCAHLEEDKTFCPAGWRDEVSHRDVHEGQHLEPLASFIRAQLVAGGESQGQPRGTWRERAVFSCLAMLYSPDLIVKLMKPIVAASSHVLGNKDVDKETQDTVTKLIKDFAQHHSADFQSAVISLAGEQQAKLSTAISAS